MVPTQTVQEVMTPDPVTVSANAPLLNVARKMHDSDIGDVIVMEDGYICGIVTDRDVVVRGMAEGKAPTTPASTVALLNETDRLV